MRTLCGSRIDQISNIQLIKFFSFFSTLTRGVWDQSIMSSYIYLITDHSSFNVGLLTGMSGMTQVLVAPVTGWVSDKYSRTRVLNTAGAVSIIATICTVFSVMQQNYMFISASMMLWGVFWAMTSPTIDALVADSVEQGGRSQVYNHLFILFLSASAGGPLVSIAMFLSMGDEWSVDTCRDVIIVGLLLFVSTSSMLFLFKGNNSSPTAAYEAVQTSDAEASEPLADIEEEEWTLSPLTRYCAEIPYVPAMIAFSDLTAGLASGMTIKFFPIFFMNNLSMKPIAVSVLYVVAPLGAAAVSVITRHTSKVLGRIYATVLAKILGVCNLLLMTYLAYYRAPTWYISPVAETVTCVRIIVTVYLIRNSLMNSAKPLTKSIIMDTVPPKQRGRWNSLESINAATWSGSALFGGYLIDHYGMYNNFLITALLQAVALIPLLIIASRVPLEKDAMTVQEYFAEFSRCCKWSLHKKTPNIEPAASPVSVVDDIEFELSPMQTDSTPSNASKA